MCTIKKNSSLPFLPTPTAMDRKTKSKTTKNQLGELTVSFMEIMQVKNNYDCSFSIVDMYGGRSKRKKYCLNKTHLREP